MFAAPGKTKIVEPRKHRTPSGLPPSNFEEGAEIWDFVQKPQNELELILKHGVWAPQTARRRKQRSTPRPTQNRTDNSVFAANSPHLTFTQLIGWWEKRRLAYNGILLGLGACALSLLCATTFAFRYKIGGLSDALSCCDMLLDLHALAWLLIASNAVFTLAGWGDAISRRLSRRPRDTHQSASLLRGAIWVSLACLMLVSVSLLHFANAR